MPLATALTVTFAPGTTAPVESVMRPVSDAVCERAVVAARNTKAIGRSIVRALYTFAFQFFAHQVFDVADLIDQQIHLAREALNLGFGTAVDFEIELAAQAIL